MVITTAAVTFTAAAAKLRSAVANAYTLRMATLHPDLRSWRPTGAGQYAERAVLEQLRDGLANGFDVFHSVEWSTVDAGVQRFGEVDVVVVDPQGHLVLLEIKAGPLEEAPAGRESGLAPRLAKQYGSHSKDVIAQSGGQLRAMRQRLHNEGFDGFKVAHLIVLPNHQIKTASLNFPRERIVDSTEIEELCHRVRTVMHQGQGDSANPAAERSRLLLFLANQFRLVPDPTARIGVLNQAVTRLSDGLATWVPRIHSEAGIYVVDATAGSGKTQLALRLLSDAGAKGLRCMYVCYNRPLADHITRVAPPAAQVSNFHELAVDHLRRQQGTVDFAEPGIFDRATQALVDDSVNVVAQLDLLVIDELQDMEAPWIDALAARLKTDGRMYLLGDSQQSVYPREPFDLAGAVHIRCQDNIRSPRRIVETINLLRLTEEPITPLCPEMGETPNIRSYPTSDIGGLRAVEGALADLLAEGVDPAHIAIVTFAGRERSKVLTQDAIAGQVLRKFTGQFDGAGNAIWTQGAVLVETLYRFKGQAAPYVILCEVDFAECDDKQRRKLFVGITRAQLHLVLVLSKAAETALAASLD